MGAGASRAILEENIDMESKGKAFRQLLRFNHPLGDHTFFQNVHTVEPGCALSLDIEGGQPRARRWYAGPGRPTDRACA